MRSDAFGNKWRVSEKSDFFEIVGDIFGCFQMALRVSWSVSNVMLSFDRFLDVLDEISYLLSLVIYREPPLHSFLDAVQSNPKHRLTSFWGARFQVDSGSIRGRFRIDSRSIQD